MTRRTRIAAALIAIAAMALFAVRQPTEGEAAPGDEQVPAPVRSRTADVMMLRIVAKKAIAGEVAEGRRSLVQAAALFGALNRLPPVLRVPLDTGTAGLPIPTRTEDECLCWQVLCWVRGGIASDRDVERATARLGAEFKGEVRARGVLRLPHPSVTAETLIEQVRGPAAAIQAEPDHSERTESNAGG